MHKIVEIVIVVCYNVIVTQMCAVVNKYQRKGAEILKIANNDIKTQARKSGIYLWQVAQRLGITDSTFSRKLRRELPQEEKEKIFDIIEELRGENNEATTN